jgi:Sec-independent protein translocase protein TatA
MDGLHLGGIGVPELFLIMVVALLSVGWRSLRKR